MTKYEQLLVLRHVTKLDVLSALKIARECRKAEEVRYLMESVDPSHSYSVDYTSANELEYSIRMAILRKMLIVPWKKYISVENDGAGLDLFIERYLNEHYEHYEQINDKSKSM